MKKICLAIVCIVTTYTSVAQLDNDTEQKLLDLKFKEKERMDKLENLNIPEYKEPYMPKQIESKETKVKKAEHLLTLSDSLNSSDQRLVDAAIQNAKTKASQSPSYRGVGLDNQVKYQEGQEQFNGSYYGFNPYISVEENKKFYAKMGFTMSYKYSDKAIYTWIFGSLSILVLIIGGIYVWNKKYRWKQL